MPTISRSDYYKTEDAIWNDDSAENLLRKLDITVDDALDAEQTERDRFADAMLAKWDELHAPAASEGDKQEGASDADQG